MLLSKKCRWHMCGRDNHTVREGIVLLHHVFETLMRDERAPARPQSVGVAVMIISTGFWNDLRLYST